MLADYPGCGAPRTEERKSFPALRGVGPEFDSGSGTFHAHTLPSRALSVKRPPFCAHDIGCCWRASMKIKGSLVQTLPALFDMVLKACLCWAAF